jgi:membrane-associated phospholipid phosphatase
MNELIKRHPALGLFLWGLVGLVIVGAIPFFVMERGDLLLLMNKNGTDFLDVFVQYFTHLGLGGWMAVLAVVFLFVRYYYSILFAAGLIAAGITTFVGKQLLFSHMTRPAKAIGKENFYRIIEGFDYSHFGSFPSGHTFTAFSTALILALVAKSKWWGAVLFLLAFLVGLSRMYLMQHFYMDVYAGGLLGSVITLMIHYWLGIKLQWIDHPGIGSNLLADYRKRKDD